MDWSHQGFQAGGTMVGRGREANWPWLVHVHLFSPPSPHIQVSTSLLHLATLLRNFISISLWFWVPSAIPFYFIWFYSIL